MCTIQCVNLRIPLDYMHIYYTPQTVYPSVSLENVTQLLESVYALLGILDQTAVCSVHNMLFISSVCGCKSEGT